MNEYISKEFMLKNLEADKTNNAEHCDPVTVQIMERFIRYVKEFPAADVQPVNQWISVKDRLPEESGTYICTAKSAGRNIVTFVKWQPRYKQWDLTGARSYWQITHWQPLPEPPKGGDTE